MCFSLTGHKYHHCSPPAPLNGSSTLFATIYDLFQGPVTGAKEGGGVRERGSNDPPPRASQFSPTLAWPLELWLGTRNPRFVASPVELGLGTRNPRFVAGPVDLG